MHRAFEQGPLQRLETPAQLEVGAQDRQCQAHQLFIGQDFFAGAIETAQLLDQLGIGFGFGKTPVVILTQGWRGRARSKQRHRFRAAKCTQGVGHFTSEQCAQTMAE
ncbi:hypothetical protein D3C76_1424650 [compost metagenome]